MLSEIKYDYSYIDEAMEKILELKKSLPVCKGKKSNYQFDYLFTNKSKGDVIDSLSNLYELTSERSFQIEILIDNIYSFLKNAKKEMRGTDKEISKGYITK